MRDRLKEKLKKRLATELQKSSADSPTDEPEKPAKEAPTVLEKPLSVAYQLMGDRTAHFMPLFKDLDMTLQKSGLKINFKAYISLTVLSSILFTTSVAVVVPVLLVFVSNP